MTVKSSTSDSMEGNLFKAERDRLQNGKVATENKQLQDKIAAQDAKFENIERKMEDEIE